MRRSAIILAGGSSTRFGQQKELVRLGEKPLILHVIEGVVNVVDEIVVVTSSYERKRVLGSLLGHNVTYAVDKYGARGPLIGALTGFETTKGEYSLLLPCDTPFFSAKVASLLLNRCTNNNIALPRWPNGFVEPLQAAYRTNKACYAVKQTLAEDKFDFRSMLSNLGGIRYVSTVELQQVDPELLTFMNINTRDDLKNAEAILEKRPHRS